MTTKLQLVEQPSEPERVAAENLKPGQFLAAGALTTGRPTEVLYSDTYLAGRGRETLIVHRPLGIDYSVASTVGGNHWFALATEQQLAEFRAGAERTDRIADIRRMADWLEDNSWAPMPHSFDGSVHLDERHLGGPSAAESYAKVREIAERLGIEPEKRLGDRTVLRVPFGRVEYSVIAWHTDGRPADPEPETFVDQMHQLADQVRAARVEDDPSGLSYSRSDDAATADAFLAQATGHRVPPHTGAMTDEGLVDETAAEVESVHMDFTTGESMCGLAATTPHKGSLVWRDVTCADCKATA